MTSTRRAGAVVGGLFLLTHVTSVPALALYGPVLNDRAFVRGAGSATQVLVGALLEVVLALAIVGTAVAVYPVVRQAGQARALGYVGLRTLEASVIAAGVVPLLTLVTLRQDGTAGGDAAALGAAMVAFHNWTFLIGPSLVCGTNTTVLASLFRQSRQVPRFIPVLGLVGGPLVFASGTAQLFGVYDQFSVWSALGAVPVFAWEICLAVYLLLRGFRRPEPGQAALPAPGATRQPVAV